MVQITDESPEAHEEAPHKIFTHALIIHILAVPILDWLLALVR